MGCLVAERHERYLLYTKFPLKRKVSSVACVNSWSVICSKQSETPYGVSGTTIFSGRETHQAIMSTNLEDKNSHDSDLEVRLTILAWITSPHPTSKKVSLPFAGVAFKFKRDFQKTPPISDVHFSSE